MQFLPSPLSCNVGVDVDVDVDMDVDVDADVAIPARYLLVATGKITKLLPLFLSRALNLEVLMGF